MAKTPHHKQIPHEDYENHSGCANTWMKSIPRAKKNHYSLIEGISIGGDQPKVFIQMYFYGEVTRKASRTNWPKHIAKFPRKWYPVESITEHLFTSLGRSLGVEMAQTRLVIFNGQLRILSQYFLRPNERLMHGADLFSLYLGDDIFVEQIDVLKMENDLVDYEDACKAIEKIFPKHASSICSEFNKMLAMDCLLGVNDRHFYNWGIIVDIMGKKPPRFSPIYDTSRGLLWNYSENKLRSIIESQNDTQIEKYVKSSKPKLSCASLRAPTHLQFFAKLSQDSPMFLAETKKLLQVGVDPLIRVVRHNFRNLLSVQRADLIEKLLIKRFALLSRYIK